MAEALIRALGRVGIALALAGSLGSCVRLNWNRQTVHVPVSEAQLEQLRPGDGMSRCLELLGAPLLVRELGGGSSALIYGWLDQQGWGFNVSAPLGDNYSASFDYDRLDSRARGILLLVDADQRLVVARRGALRDLLAELPRPRPAFDERWAETQGRD